MKRQRSPCYNLFAVLGAAGAAINISSVCAILNYEDYHLRVRHGGHIDIVEHLHDDDHDQRRHHSFDSGKLFAPILSLNRQQHRQILEKLIHLDAAANATGGEDDDDHRLTLGVCTSPLVTWTTKKVLDMGYNVYQSLYDNKILQMSFIHKHYIDKKQGSEFFVSDEQTNELQARHRQTIAFWDTADIDNSIMVNDILLLSMHGSSLSDKNNLIPTIMHIFDFDDMSEILAFATEVQRLIENLPGGYDNPLLTMNAIATSADDSLSSYVKDSIIIGDGVLEFLYDLGLDSSGPDFVHAHEFGHHVQFQIDMTVPPGSSYTNDDRRKELMADAISGYFLAHDEGGNMHPDEIGTFHKTAFSTGDCSVEDNDDHHGTPLQRQCAAIWGASLAASQDNDDNSYRAVPILDPQVFVDDFNNAYEDILRLDTMTCTLILENEETTTTSPAVVQGESPLQEEAVEDKDQWNEAVDAAKEAPTIDHENINVSWESREKLDSKHSLPSQFSSKGETEDETTIPFGYFTDPGTTPEESIDVYRSHEYEEHECDLPWIYCYYSSDGARASCVSGSLTLAVLFFLQYELSILLL